MLQVGDTVHIIKTQYAYIPKELIGRRAQVIANDSGARRLGWTGPTGPLITVRVPMFGTWWLHELELIKICASKRGSIC